MRRASPGRWALNRHPEPVPLRGRLSCRLGRARCGGARLPADVEARRAVTPSGIILPESEDDAKRVQELTAEVRTPSARLWINEAPPLVTITDDQGRMRSFHADARDEILQLEDVPVTVNARREAGRLLVVYRVGPGASIRYTYSRGSSPGQLVVDVQFLEHGRGGVVRRVYQPAAPSDSMLVPRPAPSRTSSGGEFPHRCDPIPAPPAFRPRGARQSPSTSSPMPSSGA